jgi:hypothetical protein
MIRNAELTFSPNLAAQQVNLSSREVKAATDVIVKRAGRISASNDVEERVRDAIQDRLDKWLARRAHIEAARLGYRSGTDVEGLLRDAGAGDWDVWTAAYSLRETEPEANLVLPSESVVDQTARQAPEWVYPTAAADDTDLEDEAPAGETIADPVVAE